MPYDIPKQGTCHVLRFVPLDNSYQHTMWWPRNNDGRLQQIAYFKSKAKRIPNYDNDPYTDINLSYTRHTGGVVRVGCNAEFILDCNYIMFQNAPFGQQWYYAFIVSVEYINNNTTEITYQIDVMQTWYFNYELDKCFILREHSVHDYFGENIMPEPALSQVNTYPYVIAKDPNIKTFPDDWSIMVGISEYPVNPEGFELKVGGMKSGFISGLGFVIFDANEAGQNAFRDFINQMTNANKIEAVVGAVLFPTKYLTTINNPWLTAGKDLGSSLKENTVTFTPRKFFGIESGDNSGTYTPHNNKVYQYPFNYLEIDTGELANQYRFEFFRDVGNNYTPQPIPYGNKLTFTNRGMGGMSPQISVVPNDYLKYDKSDDLGKDDVAEFETIMQNFPSIDFNVDTFKVWWAQNKISVGAQLLNASAGITAGISNASGGFGLVHNRHYTPDVRSGVTSIVGGLNTAVNIGAEVLSEGIKPNHVRGNNNSSIDIATSHKSIYYKQMQVDARTARWIDQYFDLYGYAVNELKEPNINDPAALRPHWNYIQCGTVNFRYIDATIPTSMPVEASQAITSIYQNGITFWKVPDECGHYADFDNTPTV